MKQSTDFPMLRRFFHTFLVYSCALYFTLMQPIFPGTSIAGLPHTGNRSFAWKHASRREQKGRKAAVERKERRAWLRQRRWTPVRWVTSRRNPQIRAIDAWRVGKFILRNYWSYLHKIRLMKRNKPWQRLRFSDLHFPMIFVKNQAKRKKGRKRSKLLPNKLLRLPNEYIYLDA